MFLNGPIFTTQMKASLEFSLVVIVEPIVQLTYKLITLQSFSWDSFAPQEVNLKGECRISNTNVDLVV